MVLELKLPHGANWATLMGAGPHNGNTAAGTFGIEELPLEIGQAEDIGPAFETLKADKVIE